MADWPESSVEVPLRGDLVAFLDFHKVHAANVLSYRLDAQDTQGGPVQINFEHSPKTGRYVIAETKIHDKKPSALNRTYEAWVDEASAMGHVASLAFLTELMNTDSMIDSYKFQHRVGLSLPNPGQVEHFTSLLLPTLAIVESRLKTK